MKSSEWLMYRPQSSYTLLGFGLISEAFWPEQVCRLFDANTWRWPTKGSVKLQ